MSDEKCILRTINSESYRYSYSANEKTWPSTTPNEPRVVIKKKVVMCFVFFSVVMLIFSFGPIVARILIAKEQHVHHNTSDDIDCIDENISCADSFYKFNNSCLPDCGKFQQDSHAIGVLVKFAVYWTSIFGLSTGILVLVISVIKYKYIFSFPSILLVYMTVGYCIVEIFVIITSVDSSRSLYCNNRDLQKSMNESTTFCKLSGGIFHYFLVNTVLWWFSHVSVLFYKLMAPTTAKRTKKYEKYIHVVIVCVVLVLPLPSVLYTLFSKSYVMVVFPSLLCLPRDSDVFYYSNVLVLNILIVLGVSMFIPMLWTLHKHQRILKANISGLVLSVAEVKLTIILCYYAVFGITTVLYFQIELQDQDNLFSSLRTYFTCNHCGKDEACHHNYRKYTHTTLRLLSLFVMSLIPMALLIFIVNWKKFFAFFQRLLCNCYRSGRRGRKKNQVTELSIHSALSPYPELESTFENAQTD